MAYYKQSIKNGAQEIATENWQILRTNFLNNLNKKLIIWELKVGFINNKKVTDQLMIAGKHGKSNTRI